MGVQSFRDLTVWQRSIELIEDVYRMTKTFPKHELYGITSQLQRAAVSVAANIAEGSGRESTKEYIHHLSYSLGSLSEVVTYLVVCVKLEYLPAQLTITVEEKCDSIGRMLRGLQKALRSKLRRQDGSEP